MGICLGSTEELIDAVEQYSKQRFVRINAKVERLRSTQRQKQQRKEQKRLSGVEENLVDDVTGTSPIAAAVTATPPSLPPQTQPHVTTDIESKQKDQFQNLLDSLVKVSGPAAVAIHG